MFFSADPDTTKTTGATDAEPSRSQLSNQQSDARKLPDGHSQAPSTSSGAAHACQSSSQADSQILTATAIADFFEFLEASYLSQGAKELRSDNHQLLAARPFDQLDADSGLDFLSAENFWKQELEKRKESLGGDDPQVAHALNMLGFIYQIQGRFRQAEQCLLAALEIDTKVLPPLHPNTLLDEDTLANLYLTQGEPQRAEAIYLSAVARAERMVGENHPDVKQPLARLAAFYHSQKEYDREHDIHRRCLEILSQSLGPGHPEVASAMLSTGRWHVQKMHRCHAVSNQEFREAEALLVESLKIRMTFFGNEHPSVAESLSELADLYRLVPTMLSECERLYKRSLDVAMRTLGAGHPAVWDLSYRLAALYKAERKINQAATIYENMLQVGYRTFGREHPSLIRLLDEYSDALDAIGCIDYANKLRIQADNIRLRWR